MAHMTCTAQSPRHPGSRPIGASIPQGLVIAHPERICSSETIKSGAKWPGSVPRSQGDSRYIVGLVMAGPSGGNDPRADTAGPLQPLPLAGP